MIEADNELELEQYLRPKVDATKAAANLQEASDLQRQKFMNVFQQMQASPAIMAQKTYKVKSESKQPQAAVLFTPENPFSRVAKPIPFDDTEDDLQSPFHPFDPISPEKNPKPSIFDKMDTAKSPVSEPQQ